MIFVTITSCEDVIEVNTPSGPPRLNVDAVFRVDITEEFIPIKVKVTETDSFFGETSVTSLDNIVITYTAVDSIGIETTGVLTLVESASETGIYIPIGDGISTSFLEFDIRYDLIITHKDRTYIAQTKYVPAVPINSIVQGDNILFSTDETEITIAITDNPDFDNFYIFDFDSNEYLVTEDEFYQGQEFEFSYFYDRKFESGKEIEISILGADLTFYNYMNQLIEQTDGQQGPFQTPVATVRGNVFDITGLDNRVIFDNVERPQVFPLGYFAIVQEYKSSITIQ